MTSLKRRDFLKALSVSAAALTLPGCHNITESLGVQSTEKKPNVLVVLCDDLGYGDIGCFGHPHIKTPNLDRFAREGLKLTDCYASAPVCSPSRAGMLTGRTPFRSGIFDWIPSGNTMHLKKEEVTIATLLKQAGYDTCHVGKWHCNGKFNSPDQPQPGDHGFSWWFSTQNNSRPTHRNPTNFVRNGTPVGPLTGFSSEIIADEAIDWLKNHWNKDKPFCLFVWFHAPHEPIATEDKFMTMYKGHKEAIYYGNVSQMDHAFGRLMKEIDRTNLRDNTFSFFTSDNGPETLNRYRGAQRSFGSPGPLRAMKLHLYEGGIRVPGIVRYPPLTKPSSTSDQPVNGTDILPTCCALANLKPPADRNLDGANILPILQGKKIQRPVPLYWRYDRALSNPFTVAMRIDKWKILADNKLSQFELYNLAEDLAEKNNLAKSNPRQLEKLKKILKPLHEQIDSQKPVWPKTTKKDKA